jgi:uncharacterized Zn-finger protein
MSEKPDGKWRMVRVSIDDDKGPIDGVGDCPKCGHRFSASALPTATTLEAACPKCDAKFSMPVNV